MFNKRLEMKLRFGLRENGRIAQGLGEKGETEDVEAEETSRNNALKY